MKTRQGYSLAELLEAYESGKERGRSDAKAALAHAYEDGVEEGMNLAAARVRKMLAERDGNRHDVGVAVLERALRRLAARVRDIGGHRS
jgi:hypothetical protein